MSKMGDFIELEELKQMLKAAREEAATYRIKAREKAEAEQKLEALKDRVTYYKNLYKRYKGKWEALIFAYIDDLSKPTSEKQKESAKLFTTKPLFNKPNNTMEEKPMLTENAEQYEFRGRTEMKIIEIQIPKIEELRNHNFGCKIWYEHPNNRIDWTTTDKYGNRDRNCESPWDVILKPVPKTRPMNHEEIMELRAKNFIFKKTDWDYYTFTTIIARTHQGEYLMQTLVSEAEPTLVNIDALTKRWVYSPDNGKTLLPLTVEVLE